MTLQCTSARQQGRALREPLRALQRPEGTAEQGGGHGRSPGRVTDQVGARRAEELGGPRLPLGLCPGCASAWAPACRCRWALMGSPHPHWQCLSCSLHLLPGHQHPTKGTEGQGLSGG